MLRTKMGFRVVLSIKKAGASFYRASVRFGMHMNVLRMPPQFCLSLKMSFVLAILPSASEARIMAAIVASLHRESIGFGMRMDIFDMLPQVCVLLKMPLLRAVHPAASKALLTTKTDR